MSLRSPTELRAHVAAMTAACMVCGCSSSGSKSASSSIYSGQPFVWDAGPDASPGCSYFDCLSYVVNLCPIETSSGCAASSMTLTSNAIVVQDCFSDGSHRTVTEYASSSDAIFYAPDGGECLHAIVPGVSGPVVLEDPPGRTLAELNDTASSAGANMCGRITVVDPTCDEDGGAHAQLPALNPCSSQGVCSPNPI